MRRGNPGAGIAGDHFPDDLLHQGGGFVRRSGGGFACVQQQLMGQPQGGSAVDHRIMGQRHQIGADVVRVDPVGEQVIDAGDAVDPALRLDRAVSRVNAILES